MKAIITPDPQLDLVLERTVPVSPEKVWRAWTRPEDLMQWFCPKPWQTVECEMELRPGGKFRTVMQGPDGERFDNVGCYLEVVENERLTFTSAMGPNFRPSVDPMVGIAFTAVVSFEPKDGGTLYRVVAVHADQATRDKHNEMGFEHGWGAALDQLVELAQSW